MLRKKTRQVNLWSTTLILDMIDNGIKKIEGYRFFLLLTDTFVKNGWGIPLKHNTAQTTTKELFDIFRESYRNPNLGDTDDGIKPLRKLSHSL